VRGRGGNADEEGVDWEPFIESCSRRYAARVRPPLAEAEVRGQLGALRVVHADLVDLYRVSNGLSLEWFGVFSLFDALNVKETWESLARVNDARATTYLGGDMALLDRFLVFASVGPGEAAVVDRNDGSIWYEEAGELHQTTWNMQGFVESALREVSESQ
jgi:hypothetical protein